MCYRIINLLIFLVYVFLCMHACTQSAEDNVSKLLTVLFFQAMASLNMELSNLTRLATSELQRSVHLWLLNTELADIHCYILIQ